MEACISWLEEAYNLLYALGLDLITEFEDPTTEGVSAVDNPIPNGFYYLRSRIKRWGGKLVKATMEVKDDQFILKSGSIICPIETPTLDEVIRKKRFNAHIVDNVLREDIHLNSASQCEQSVIGATGKSWRSWKLEDKRGAQSIDIFRKIDADSSNVSGS